MVTLFVIEPADPAFANVVTAITSEHAMDLIDQLACEHWYFWSPVRSQSSRKLQTAKASVQRYLRGLCATGDKPLRRANSTISRAAIAGDAFEITSFQ